MTLLNIISAPDPILLQNANYVQHVTTDTKHLIQNLLKTMYANNGIGLAAPQVGISKRIIVIDLQELEEKSNSIYPLFMINPSIQKFSIDSSIEKEGCLSLPNCMIDVLRPFSITVSFINIDNETVTLNADGWLARVIQHEIDHLHGKLLLDYLTTLKKDVTIRKLKKLKKYSL